MIYDIVKLLLKEYRDIALKILGVQVKKPLMKWKEIEIIKEILIKLKPRQCLEWGSGFSTLYFPRFTKCKWIAIEHDVKWFERIRKLIKSTQIKLYLLPPNKYPWSDPYGDGDYEDLKDYVEFPSRFGNFDFILIDGRARVYCLTKAYELLDDYGIVVLHDANREYYHEPFKLYPKQVLFRDYRKDSGGLWIGSKKRDINLVLDVRKHMKRWELINKYFWFLRI